MEELINLLHTGGYSCTIANKGEIRTLWLISMIY